MHHSETLLIGIICPEANFNEKKYMKSFSDFPDHVQNASSADPG